MQNLCFRPKCTISGHQSCEASILVHWTQNDVCECFSWLRLPSTHKNLQNLCFRPKCTILGYQSGKASILVHWTQNDVWECFLAFRKPCTCKRCKICVSGLTTIFRGTIVVKHPFQSIGPKIMFGSVSEHFANLQHTKICKTCVLVLIALFRGTKVVKHPF
jgi:hypothetical protein